MRFNSMMSVAFFGWVNLFVGAGCAGPASHGIAGDATLSFSEESRISNVRQMTFGGTNAEAYWSYDGRFLTYQHSGDDAKCDQIYRMSVDGKTRNRVSDGLGRTTCSFYMPGDRSIVFASTEASSRACPPDADKSKGYVWPIYPTYQFYRADPEGKESLPIEPGAPSAYNAEMVTCKDGRAIFTSDRNGDLDLYTARFDGNGLMIDIKQITKTLGYDGGAFFSPDCRRIVWRASRPKPGHEANEYIALLGKHLVKPTELEIWTANADGTNARQITKLGAATFAPYFTPDGDHVVFATNYGKPGGRNFDIYMVRTNGTELEQVTHSRTFDSFPMFSPDGKWIAFSSNRNARKPHETNVFIGEWNARLPGPIITDEDPNPVNRWYMIARELSTSDMEGRGLGTEGLRRAEDYVSELFAKAGIREINPPGGGGIAFGDEIKGFEHEIEVVRGVKLDEKDTALSAGARTLQLKTDFAPASFSTSGKLSGSVIEVGYGIVAPELGVDDYANKSVKGRVVLIRQRTPPRLNHSVAQQSTYGNLRYKAFLARERGAAGVAFWEPEATAAEKPGQEDLMISMNESTSSIVADAGIPVVFINSKLAREWMTMGKPVSLSGKISLESKRTEASNIIGYMGSESACRAGHPVVIGAHLDHLGYGGENSLQGSKDRIVHPGADDNASGVASLLEAARIVGRALKEKRASGCFLFAAFTAEESGVIGSSRFVDLLRKKKIHPKAMLNLDMVGRLTDNSLNVFGADSAIEWKKIVKRHCDATSLTCPAGGDGYGPSDHMPFYVDRVPVLHFFTGAHSDYHRASDSVEKVNPVGGVQIAELVASIAIEAADRKTRFNYVRKSGTHSAGTLPGSGHEGSRGFSAYLGTIPNYSQMTGGLPAMKDPPKGVLLSGAREGSPAAEGGVRENDIIVGMVVLDDAPGFPAATPKKSEIQSLEDYTFVLRSLKPGMRVRMEVRRRGEVIPLSITVGRKETSR